MSCKANAKLEAKGGEDVAPGVVIEADPVERRPAIWAGVADAADGAQGPPVELPGAQEVQDGVVAPGVVAQRCQRAVPPDQQPPLSRSRLEGHVVVHYAHLRRLAACP